MDVGENWQQQGEELNMHKPFLSTAAKKLIHEHRELLQWFDEADEIEERYRQEAAAAEQAWEQAREGDARAAAGQAAIRFALAQEKYQSSRPYAAECRRIAASERVSIEQAMTNLSPACGLHWFILSAEEQQKAVDAYHFLERLIWEQYGLEARRIIAGLVSVERITEDEVRGKQICAF